MKRLFVSFVLSGAALFAAGLADVRKVYMLPMGSSLDQYLANRLTNGQVFQVVTDPALADAVFTDRIGEGFETRMAELLPPPEPPKPEKEAETKESSESRGDAGPGDPTANKLQKVGAMSTLTRARGTVFLVDLKSHEVIWSAFEPAQNSSPKQMDATAAQIVSLIKRELKKK